MIFRWVFLYIYTYIQVIVIKEWISLRRYLYSKAKTCGYSYYYPFLLNYNTMLILMGIFIDLTSNDMAYNIFDQTFNPIRYTSTSKFCSREMKLFDSNRQHISANPDILVLTFSQFVWKRRGSISVSMPIILKLSTYRKR